MRPAFRETTSLGAALAAGLAINMWTREEVFAAAPQPAPHPQPIPPMTPPHLQSGEGLLPDELLDDDTNATGNSNGNARGAAVVAAMAFHPAVTPEAASRRYSRWHKAVERSLELADLAPEPWESETAAHGTAADKK